MLFTTVTFWVIVVVVLGIILKVTFGVGAPRPVTTLVSYAFVGVLFGVATAVVWNVLKLIATIPLPGGINAVLIGIVLWLLVMAVLYWLSANYEGLPAQGRFTGKGVPLSQRLGVPVASLLIGFGVVSLRELGFNIPGWWLFIAIIAGLVICAVTHLSGNDLYGYEEDGEPLSSNDSPTKIFHDYVVRGVFMSLHLLTWIPSLFAAFLGILLGEATLATMIYTGVILAMLFIYLIVAIACHRRVLDSLSRTYPVPNPPEPEEE